MKKLLITISLIFGMLLTSAVFHNLNAQTVSGLIDKKTIRRGRAASGRIILTIPSDLHINSSKPNDEFTVPTSVKFNGSNVKINRIIYPKGIFQKFDFSSIPLSVYEGQAIIKFTF